MTKTWARSPGVAKHLADSLANEVQLTAAAGAGLMPQIELDVVAHQMRRQARAIVRRLRPGRLLCAGRKLGFGTRKIDGQVFETELELILVEPLGASAELAALQLLDDDVEPLDLGLCFVEGHALGGK